MQPNAHGTNRRKWNSSKRLVNCEGSSCVIGCFSLALIGPSSQKIGGAANTPPTAVQNVGVDHGRANVVVAQQFLHRTDVDDGDTVRNLNNDCDLSENWVQRRSPSGERTGCRG